jgi:hypothetical protein
MKKKVELMRVRKLVAAMSKGSAIRLKQAQDLLAATTRLVESTK